MTLFFKGSSLKNSLVFIIGFCSESTVLHLTVQFTRPLVETVIMFSRLNHSCEQNYIHNFVLILRKELILHALTTDSPQIVEKILKFHHYYDNVQFFNCFSVFQHSAIIADFVHIHQTISNFTAQFHIPFRNQKGKLCILSLLPHRSKLRKYGICYVYFCYLIYITTPCAMYFIPANNSVGGFRSSVKPLK